MSVELRNYEDIYNLLEEFFTKAFGMKKNEGSISINKVRDLIIAASGEDVYKGINSRGNRFIDIPSDLHGEMVETYLGRDKEVVSGPIGCSGDPNEELDGITNIALLMFLSNFYTKEYQQEVINRKVCSYRSY